MARIESSDAVAANTDNAETSTTAVAATSTPAPDGERKARVVVEYIGGDETDEEGEEGVENTGDPATEDLLAVYPDETEVCPLTLARHQQLIWMDRLVGHRSRPCSAAHALQPSLTSVRAAPQEALFEAELYCRGGRRGCGSLGEAGRVGFV
jgi:hypothetical protein